MQVAPLHSLFVTHTFAVGLLQAWTRTLLETSRPARSYVLTKWFCWASFHSRRFPRASYFRYSTVLFSGFVALRSRPSLSYTNRRACTCPELSASSTSVR